MRNIISYKREAGAGAAAKTVPTEQSSDFQDYCSKSQTTDKLRHLKF